MVNRPFGGVVEGEVYGEEVCPSLNGYVQREYPGLFFCYLSAFWLTQLERSTSTTLFQPERTETSEAQQNKSFLP